MHALPALLLVMAAFAPCIGFADEQTTVIETITLQHRQTDELVSILKPLLEPGDAVTGMHNQLIIKTSPARLQQVKALIEQLDQAAKQFLVSVRFVSARALQEFRQGIAAEARLGNENAEGNEIDIRGRISSTRSQHDDKVDQQMRVLEGSTASFYRQRTRQLSSGTLTSQQLQGFTVSPRLSGPDSVTLTIQPIYSRAATRSTDQNTQTEAFTTVTLPAGQWTEIAGLSSDGRQAHSRTYSTTRSRAEEQAILVKVDLIP